MFLRCLFLLSLSFIPCSLANYTGNAQNGAIPGFETSTYFDEQVMTFRFNTDVRIVINAPSVAKFNPALKTEIAVFALPNGNTIEQTIGKVLKTGDDWHYDIQHIGAQTRFLREHITDYNIVTAYLECSQLSWPTWRSTYSNNAVLINNIVDSIKNIFKSYNPSITLTGHSGGGSFTFGFMNGVASIPNSIDRISFLDSDYNYDDATYGAKILTWINASPEHYLSVIAYNDSIALYNGAPVVSATGGTWYRSKMMQKYLANYFQFTSESDSVFIKYTALNGRIKFILKQNPTRAILHTVQVELNGFIQGMVSGTQAEGQGYVYYGSRAYTKWIQSEIPQPAQMTIPARPANAKTGSQFMNSIMYMSFDQREAEILKEISAGNIPDFMRTPKRITSYFQDASGTSHKVSYEVLPDYLAIGSNSDYCRIPMGPVTAQKIANLFGATLPTSKLVDDIYANADVKLAPVTYTPVGDSNSSVAKFIEHNAAIEAQRAAAGAPLGYLVGGIKKDVIISIKILEKPGNVVIYGWHQLNGQPIQPVYNGHVNYYLDYSHGIRLLNKQIIVDSVVKEIPKLLTDPVFYKILSNEASPMTQPSYLSDANIPSVPKSFGIKSESSSSLRIIIKPDTLAKEYAALLSGDGLTFTDTIHLYSSNSVINNLTKGKIYYIKICANNTAGSSAFSELLCGIPSSYGSKAIIVNGYDRASTGNTYNFVRQHASALLAAGLLYFDSATNDAIVDGLFSLNNYNMADYILGDESTADETFSSAEQDKVKAFLDAGNNLIVSGSEIAWDLDAKGTSADKSFIWNYLKAKYIADAPNGTSGTYYKAEGILKTPPFGNISQFGFDDGTHGTINVKWPDAIKGNAGGIPFLKYSGVDTSNCAAGIYYEGKFGGSATGRVVTMSIPFETIYPESARNVLMSSIVNFFSMVTGIKKDKTMLEKFELKQNYPNPFNPSTKIEFYLPESGKVSLKIYDITGKEITTLINEEKPAGKYTIEFSSAGKNLASGVYFYKLSTENAATTKSMVLLK